MDSITLSLDIVLNMWSNVIFIDNLFLINCPHQNFHYCTRDYNKAWPYCVQWYFIAKSTSS